ncbi:type II toxin-antitoxin system RelE/ParE family toxin [Devosia sp. YR412]|uniref:type II toxin-antitoxin system RelE family toxin n=1 Tax=Devosia sp. YR412 TaxID=1881030 RepID=UPI000B87DF5A|nr:type II toxin-antitoxin system RelE/ParE family toxin [Devosia sp. YR412]
MKQIIYSRVALQTLGKMPRNSASRIRSKISAYAADPASQANNVKKLKGTDAIRLRVGDWRVVMEDGFVLDVLRIGPRGSVYD